MGKKLERVKGVFGGGNSETSDGPIPPSVYELEHIKQAVRDANSRHHELSPATFNTSAIDLVKKVISEYDKLTTRYFDSQKDVRTVRNEKLQAEAWARRKEEILDHERDVHAEKVRRLKDDHAAKMRRLQEDHAEKLNMLQNDYAKQVKGMINGYEEQLRIKKDKYSRIITDLKDTHAEKEHELVQQHEDEMRGTRAENEELKLGLSSREHIKGLADREVAAQFKTLSTDIEDVARTEWDPSGEHNWPYSDLELRSLRPRNSRKLKQQIVQNCVWVALYEHVFRTPFRIIGDHGRIFDSEMYEANSPEYDALEEAESADLNMKRYENAKVFQAALGSTVPRSENDELIVQSYERARAAVLSMICHALERVTTLNEEECSAVDSILKSATKMWLDICCQRYRLFVIMPNEHKDVLSLARGDVNYLQLVIKPELQRFGNHSGTEMRQGEAVAGWRGQMEVYPASN